MARLEAAVLGGGSFGTALAVHLARQGHRVRLWDRDPARCARMNAERRNPRYLTDVVWPEALTADPDLLATVREAELVVPVVPSHALRDVARRAAPGLRPGAVICSGTKGIENESLDTVSTILSEEVPVHCPVTVLSGPSFARELADGKPTTVVVAGEDAAAAHAAAEAFHGGPLRVYDTHDVVGVCVGGSLKNVMAIATGFSDGLELGHNARAGIITRGLAEITRLAVAMGGEQITMMGLAGLGDLVLTCTGDLSRNRRVGLGLGAGRTLDEVTAEIGEVAEGVKTAASAFALSQQHGIEMPITEQVYRVLHEGRSPVDAVRALAQRERKHEQA